MYIIIFLLALMFIIIPIIAEKYNSVNASIFLFSLGYSGLSFNERKNDKRAKLSREEYLKISKITQCILGAAIIIAASIMYFLKVDQYLAFVIILPIGFIGSMITWLRLKKYKV